MSIETPQSESPDHDELVAYLDGELGPAECRAVEQRLAQDPEFQQELRDLDQAWEALNVLPTTSVDDAFARTTIELACVAAQEDLTKRTQVLNIDNRGRKRWWIAGGIAAALLGFVLMRAAAVRHENRVLSELPVVEQLNALGHVQTVDFLRKLSASVPVDKLVSDQHSFDRAVGDYTSAVVPSLADRRTWVRNLTPEQKSDLAERAQAYDSLRANPQEKERLRRLADEINQANDAPRLRTTLVAFGQWLSQQTAGDKEQLRAEALKKTVDERVESIRRLVQRQDERASRRLQSADAEILRREIFQHARRLRDDALQNMPQGAERKRIAEMDPNNGRAVLFFALRSVLQSGAGDETMDELVSKLGPDANEHWNKIPRWQRNRRIGQFLSWIHDAIPAKPGPKELENFFSSDKLSQDEKQELLDKPRAEMEADLERRYLKSELGIELGDAFRNQRGRFGDRPPEGGRPGENWRGDGPPPRGERFGPERRPGERFDRERPPGQDGPRGMRPEDGPPGRPRRPRDQIPPEGPPPREGETPPRPPDGKLPV